MRDNLGRDNWGELHNLGHTGVGVAVGGSGCKAPAAVRVHDSLEEEDSE